MKTSAAYRNFELATEDRYMMTLFTPQQDRFCARDERLTEMVIPRVFPRKDNSLAIQYRLTIEHARTQSRRTLLLFGEQNLGGAPTPGASSGHSDHALSFPELNLIVPLFPHDPKLEMLRRIGDAESCQKYLNDQRRKLGWEGEEVSVTKHEVLGYRLHRRAVIRLSVTLTNTVTGVSRVLTLIARIVRPDTLPATILAQNGIREAWLKNTDAELSSVPKIQFVDDKHGVYLMESVDGVNLSDLTGQLQFVRTCERAGNLLARLHLVPHTGWPPYTVEKELAELSKKVALSTAIFPSLQDPCSRILQQLHDSRQWVNAPGQAATIHRDFYDKQLIASGERLTLLDFDSLAAGDPALDYGNFLAHCQLRQLQEPHHAKSIAQGAMTFADGYGHKDTAWDLRANWWQASTLLRLTTLYALRPKWRGICHELIINCNNVMSNLKSGSRVTDALKK